MKYQILMLCTKENIIFLLEYIKEILNIFISSWPFVVLVISIMFKNVISNFVLICTSKIGNISKIKMGTIELETMDKVIEKFPAKDDNSNNEASYPLEIQFLQVWIDFERKLKTLVPKDNQTNNIRFILNYCRKNEIITPQEYNVIRNIMLYRNFVAHGGNFSTEDIDVYYFIDFLKSMIIKLDGEKQ